MSIMKQPYGESHLAEARRGETPSRPSQDIVSEKDCIYTKIRIANDPGTCHVQAKTLTEGLDGSCFKSPRVVAV